MTYSSRLANMLVFRCGKGVAGFAALAAFLALALGQAGIVAHAANRVGQRGRFHQQIAHLFEQIVELEWLQRRKAIVPARKPGALPRPPIRAPRRARARGLCLPRPPAPAPIPSASGRPGSSARSSRCLRSPGTIRRVESSARAWLDDRHNTDLPALRVQQLAQGRLVRLIVLDNQDADLGQVPLPSDVSSIALDSRGALPAVSAARSQASPVLRPDCSEPLRRSKANKIRK